MPTLIYSIVTTAAPLEIAAQALRAAQVQAYAVRKGLAFAETQSQASERRFQLVIPLDELNNVLDELLFASLLHPLQELHGRPGALVILHERFSTLTWVDTEE